MQFKAFLLSIMLIAISGGLYAQDKIYKKDRKVIMAKVKAVTDTTITYRRDDKPDGPDYTIFKKDVAQIRYKNGTKDKFGRAHMRNAAKKGKFVNKYGINTLYIIPAAYTAGFDGTMNDLGLGLGYERQLDKRGHLSFTLPVLISFSPSKDFTGWSGTSIYYNQSPNGNAPRGGYHSYSIMPGIKFYPAGSNERVRYSLGASFFAIFGSEPYAIYDDPFNPNITATTTGAPADWNYAVYGFLLSNSVNIRATKHFDMAIDLGMGVPISDNRFADTHAEMGGYTNPFLQFGLKLGYRF